MSSQFASLCVIAYEVAIRTHLVCVLSRSLCLTLPPHGLEPARLLCL